MTATIDPASPRLTDEQNEVVESSIRQGAATLVLGGAGSGKTTTLVACVVRLLREQLSLPQIVVLTASRAQAQELRSTIVAALGSSQSGIQTTTMHGWCQHLLAQQVATPMPRLLTGPQQEYHLRELLAASDPVRWPAEYVPALTTRAFSAQIRRVLARARQLGLDPESLSFAGEHSDQPAWTATGYFFGEYLDVLDAEQAMDYTELVHRCRLAMLDAAFRTRVLPSARVILVDEFAELDSGMINLLADFHDVGSTVIAFGDPDTRVFDFRGADPHAVADFRRRFGAPEREARLLPLSRCLRPGNGLDRVIDRIAWPLPDTGVGHRLPEPGPIPGLVLVACPDDAAQARDIADRLGAAHRGQGVDWSDMVVITHRGASSSSHLARRLAACGIPVRVVGDQMALSEEIAVSHLVNAAKVAVDLAEQREIEVTRIVSIIRSPLTGLDDLAIRHAARILRQRVTTESTPAPGASQVLADHIVRPDLIAADESDPTLRALHNLAVILHECVQAVRRGADVATILWLLWHPSPWPDLLYRQALGSGAEAAGANRDLDAVIALFDLAERQHDLSGGRGLRFLVDDIARQQIAADTARESNRNAGGVQVMSAHRAKGGEWEVVVITDAEEGNWPSPVASIDLLHADALGMDGLQPPPGPAEHLAQERRAFLLAVSRAKSQLVVSWVQSRDGEDYRCSRYVRELGDEMITAGAERLWLGADELVGQLRRIGTDPNASQALRQAAAVELAWLAAQTDTRGRHLVPAADPARWWAIRDITHSSSPMTSPEAPVRLTGSGLESLLACPRRWFLAKRARAERPQPLAATLGSQIHEIIARGYSEGLGVDQMVDLLVDDWPVDDDNWRAKAQLAEARACLERYARWAELPEHQDVLGVEVNFDIEVTIDGQPLTLVGAVDRLEWDAARRLRVVDFKTGRRAPSRSEVQTMNQLGFYQFAISQGAFDGHSGGQCTPADAQLVYLMIDDRGGYPTCLGQASLAGDDEWIRQNLAEAAGYLRQEYFPARAQRSCRYCPFAIDCPVRNRGEVS